MQKIFPVLITLLILIVSCNDSVKIRKRDVLNEEEFYDILRDIHHTDGVITASGLRNNKYQNDSISLYNYVLKKHNVSRKEFSNTVQYYSKDTEKYVEIYDSLIVYFKALDKEILDKQQKDKEKERELKKKEDSLNLWELKKEWLLPDDGKRNPIAYKIYVSNHGTYTLKAKIKVFKDDKSKNLRMTIIANYEDGTKDLNTIAVNFLDQRRLGYEVSITTDKHKYLKSISGWVLDHSKNTIIKHVHVKDIKMKYSNEDEELSDSVIVKRKDLISN